MYAGGVLFACWRCVGDVVEVMLWRVGVVVAVASAAVAVGGGAGGDGGVGGGGRVGRMFWAAALWHCVDHRCCGGNGLEHPAWVVFVFTPWGC